MSTLKLAQVGSMVYPVMLAEQSGEISEAKAAELIGLPVQRYREEKSNAIQAVMCLVNQLPSPLSLLAEAMRGQQKSLDLHMPAD